MGIFSGLDKLFKRRLRTETKAEFTPRVNQVELQNLRNKLKALNVDVSPSVNIYLLSKFFDISSTKQDLINEIDEIKSIYISQLIVNRIIEDALTPLIDEDFYKIQITDSQGNIDNTLTEMINEFVETINLKNILLDISQEILFYGEYFLRIETLQNEGIINIKDDVDISSIIPVFRDSQINYYIKYFYEEKKIETVQPNNFVYFYLPGNRIRVKTHSADDKVLYIRMGKSLFYPVFGLLKELDFFEKLLPTSMIQKLNSPKLIGVNVPSNTPPSEAIEIAKVYQKMIDRNMFKDNNYNSVDELLKTIQNTSKVKVIPIWDNKGDLNPKDIGNESDIDEMQNKIQDIREMIMKTLGLPVSLISSEPELKVDLIKQNISYTKKIKNLQQALEIGIKQLINIHLVNLGYNINYRQIKINFVNTVNYEQLSKLEVADITISMMENIKTFLDEIDDIEKVNVNKKEFINLLNSNLRNIFGKNLIEYEEEN